MILAIAPFTFMAPLKHYKIYIHFSTIYLEPMFYHVSRDEEDLPPYRFPESLYLCSMSHRITLYNTSMDTENFLK